MPNKMRLMQVRVKFIGFSSIAKETICSHTNQIIIFFRPLMSLNLGKKQSPKAQPKNMQDPRKPIYPDERHMSPKGSTQFFNDLFVSQLMSNVEH